MTFLELDKVEWIQIISALGTLLAAIAAWRSSNASKNSAKISENQLIEMKMQRLSNYKPSLVFTGSNYEVKTETDISIDSQYPYLTLTNIGFGAAKELKVEWEDFEFIDYSDEMFSIVSSFIEVRSPFNENRKSLINKKLDLVQEIDNLFPASDESKTKRVRVPSIAIYYIINRYTSIFKEGLNEGDVPIYNLYFTVTYQDINNETYIEKQTLNISLSMITSNELRLNLTISN